MKRFLKNILTCGMVFCLASCTPTTKLLKSPDYNYKLEKAKQFFAEGNYSNASLLLDNVLPAFRNTKSGDEALFLMGMCKYLSNDFDSASELFKRYYTRSYPAGEFVDEARFYSAKSYYNSTLPTKLDQTNTYTAIDELTTVAENNPSSKYVPEVKRLIFELQDQLVEKEYMAASLYFKLGGYFGNCDNSGGNNYQACVITAQNAIKTYPYTKRREDFAILILRAKYRLAKQSIEIKKYDRLNDTLDEYYGFVNEFPNSTHLAEAKDIYEKTDKELKSSKLAKYSVKETE